MPRTAAPPAADARLRRLDSLGRLLDDSIPIPGTNRRFGVEALIGLVPGVGDGVGALLSTYIIVEAARFGLPRATLVRMAGHVALEAVVGAVPVLGDLFDAAYKANLRNVALLKDHVRTPVGANRANRRFAVGLVAGLIIILIGAGAAAVWLAAAVLRAIGAL